MVELFVPGLLEREDLRALGIQPAHDVLDDAVFAGRVHCLEDEQKRPAILGVEFFLQRREPLDACGEPRDCRLPVPEWAGTSAGS